MAGAKGRSGRPRKPTELHVLHGTDRADRQHPDEPKPELLTLVPDPPVELDPVARKEWDRIGPELVRLHLLSNLDLAALVGYVRAVSAEVAAAKHIARHGRYQRREKGGGFQLNPAVRDLYRAAELKRGYLIEFGMSPSSRARVVTGGGGSVGNPNGEGQGPRPRPVNRLGQVV